MLFVPNIYCFFKGVGRFVSLMQADFHRVLVGKICRNSVCGRPQAVLAILLCVMTQAVLAILEMECKWV